jgi:hypothetical protein
MLIPHNLLELDRSEYFEKNYGRMAPLSIRPTGQPPPDSGPEAGIPATNLYNRFQTTGKALLFDHPSNEGPAT